MHRKGLTLNHPPTHPPACTHHPTALVSIATVEDVGGFFFFFFLKGQAAARGILEDIRLFSMLCY